MIDKISPLIPPIGPAKPIDRSVSQPGGAETQSAKRVFAEYLTDAISERKEVKFSAHAQRRLVSRGIEISGERGERLASAVDLAQKKGGRDSLILMDELALIVNVPTRTVVTAIERDGLAERVVTNIDSAVFG